MRILVLGANDFIGSHIIKKFLDDKKENHKILAIDNSDSNLQGYVPLISTFLYVDVIKIANVKKSIKEFDAELIIDCSWIGKGDLAPNTNEQFYTNVPRSIWFLQNCTNLLTSTKSKYVGIGGLEKRKNPNTWRELSVLTINKYSKLICDKSNTDWTWINTPSLYGEYDYKTNFIPNLINDFLLNKEIKVKNPNEKLNLLYIDDFIDSLFNLLITSNKGTFNFLSENEYKVKDIVEIIKKYTKSKSKITLTSSKSQKDITNTLKNSNIKSSTIIKCSSQINLDQGLKQTINYYKSLK